MATRLGDLRIFDGLSIVHIDGFEPERTFIEGIDRDGNLHEHETTEPDPPGCANYLVSEYGTADDDFEEGCTGILWTDYDGPGWQFSVLLADDEIEAFKGVAAEAGYTIGKVEPITEPTTYGDSHAGTVAILKHPDGWVVMS